MKIKSIALLTVLLIKPLIASNEVNIKTNPVSVKVFLRGAELQHTAKLKVDKGITDLVLGGLASNIDRNSINVTAKGEVLIVSVLQRFDYLKPAEENSQIISLEDSLEAWNRKLSLKQNENEILKLEIDLILANKQIGGGNKDVNITELNKMADYLRKRIGEIKTRQLSLAYDMKKLEKEIERIKKQLEELNARLNRPSNEVVVTVSAKNTAAIELSLSYFIYEAGWQPVYDVRVNRLDAPAYLNYKANIRQNSGLDWNDINIILSTRSPVQNNNKPVLNPWFIDFQTHALYKEDRMSIAQKAAAALPVSSGNFTAETMADYFMVEEKQLSVEFTPSIKYSIPSDNKPHTVAIQEFSIPAYYEYYAAPKLDANAFLLAYLTKWNNYNLLPGQANIYFDNSYVGQSFINTLITRDTLVISLGRDQNITVKREVLKDFTEDKFLSSDVERFFGYDIVLRNNKSSDINILVEEQIPISKNEDIKVKVIDIEGGRLNQKDGFVTWKINLEPSKSINRKFVYSVRYPKDKTISGI
ncbi:MAG: mucoidy inhibitor MuiA family protein [Bacteroidota bacterium]